MADKLDEAEFYKLSLQLWDFCWRDTEILKNDFRGKEIARQMIRSVGSVSANIEEGYGRSFGKEFINFLRYSKGSARESRGWYMKSKFLLEQNLINERVEMLSKLIAILTKTIQTLEAKNK